MKLLVTKWLRIYFLASILLYQGVFYVSVVNAQEVPRQDHNLLAQLDKQSPTNTLAKYSGPEESIKQFLCTPSDDPKGFELYECINRLYRFGITIGALALVFFVVLAGYFYIVGGEQSKAKGKAILASAITGMLILLGSYTLLNFINPNLARFRTIQPPIFNAQLPKCEDIGFGANCVISTGENAGQTFYAGTVAGETGQCTAANLSKCGKWKVDEAIAVCNKESRGSTDAKSGTDLCSNINGPDGKPLSFSYGLMQVSLASMGDHFPDCKNILTYKMGEALRQPGECPGGFKRGQNGTEYCAARLCTAPRGEEILQKCAKLLLDKANNIDASCTLYGNGCWKKWPDTAKVIQDYAKCPR